MTTLTQRVDCLEEKVAAITAKTDVVSSLLDAYMQNQKDFAAALKEFSASIHNIDLTMVRLKEEIEHTAVRVDDVQKAIVHTEGKREERDKEILLLLSGKAERRDVDNIADVVRKMDEKSKIDWMILVKSLFTKMIMPISLIAFIIYFLLEYWLGNIKIP